MPTFKQPIMKKTDPFSYTRIPSTDVDVSQLSSLHVDGSFSPPLVRVDRLDTDPSHLALATVYSNEFRAYLAPWLEKGSEQANFRQTARHKLLRLTREQLQELSADIYDELIRRKTDSYTPTPVPFLLPQEGFHPKRNQARQKLSTLPTSRFRDLCGDVFHELCRRYPECREQPYNNFPSPGVPNAPSERSAPFGNTSGNPPRGGTVIGTAM